METEGPQKQKGAFLQTRLRIFMQNVFAISFRFRNPIKRSHRKEEIQYPFYVHIFSVTTMFFVKQLRK